MPLEMTQDEFIRRYCTATGFDIGPFFDSDKYQRAIAKMAEGTELLEIWKDLSGTYSEEKLHNILVG